MREIFCDRCGDNTTLHRKMFLLKVLIDEPNADPLDLCSSCETLLDDWLVDGVPVFTDPHLGKK
jgi:hypothetical protein